MSLGGKKSGKKEPWFIVFTGGLSSSCAALFTQPVDLVKVRQQLAGEGIKGGRQNSFKTFIGVIKQDGFFGLYNGFSASIARQLTYSTVRYGVYPSIKNFGEKYCKFSPTSVANKFLSGMAAGALGCIAGNPCDLTLVRMQADKRLPVEARRNYKGILNGIGRIIKEEGIFALWKGCSPNLYRAMFMTATQIGSYDQLKQMLLKTSFFKDNTLTHFTASSLAGIIATIITSPLDVVKTRFMNQKSVDGQKVYTSVANCFKKTYQAEGILAFYKGFGPNASRLVPHTILTFIFYEKVYKLLTGQYFGPKKPEPTKT
jgi:hypothetical protein